jgi:hypothetical protein
MNITQQYIYDPEGNKAFVVLPFAEYQQLLEQLEDAADLKTFAERRVEPKDSMVLEDFLEELKNEGRISR